MDTNIILAVAITFVVSVSVTYIFVTLRARKQVGEFRSICKAIDESNEKLAEAEKNLHASKAYLEIIDNETKELQELKSKADQLQYLLQESTRNLEDATASIDDKKGQLTSLDMQLHEIMSRIDIYSRLEEFVDYGMFEIPDYLYETSARFAEEIKRVRERQKYLIKDKSAISYPDYISITSDASLDKKIIDGQVKLMLAAFNIECDLLISKVNPGNFSRTLECIEKLAAKVEKSAATLYCGFNIKYIELKYEECKLQYQFKLKQQEEHEEQRLIREQMREEQRAIKECEQAIARAKEEEQMYREMLEKARRELELVTEEERANTEQRIAELERRLLVAEEKEQRAKSMAEQTRCGYVYVISNIGSFGEDIYKIGMTRRLEPLDRVKELGDASVPFAFDVHAMIHSDDAPAVEASLHREFNRCRVNAVNLRKEFFRVDLLEIKNTVEKLIGDEANFKMTVLAEEYYESRRLQSEEMRTA